MRKIIGALVVVGILAWSAVSDAAPYSASYCGNPSAGYAFSWSESTNPSDLVGHQWVVYGVLPNNNPYRFVAWGWPNTDPSVGTAVAIGSRWFPATHNNPGSAYTIRFFSPPTSVVSVNVVGQFRNGTLFINGGNC